MKIYIKNYFEADVTEEESKEIQENPSWRLLANIMNKARLHTVPQILTEEEFNKEIASESGF